jgi:hypothetical protein
LIPIWFQHNNSYINDFNEKKLNLTDFLQILQILKQEKYKKYNFWIINYKNIKNPYSIFILKDNLIWFIL